MLALFRFKSLIFGLSLILLAGILACGEGATPTPTAQPTQDVAAIVQQVLSQQEQPDVLTAADIQQLVQGVVTQALSDQPAPEGLTAQQVQDLVQNAIAATIQPGASALELQTAIAAAVGAIEPGISAEDVQAVVQQAVAGALAALPTPTSLASVEPTGTLDMGIVQLGPTRWLPKDMPFRTTQWEVVGFAEQLLAYENAPSSEIGVRLLEEFSIDLDSAGNTVYTMRLRQGIPFQTRFGLWGELTVDDLIFTVENVAEEASVHPRRGHVRRTFFCDVCQVERADNYTLKLTRDKPTFDIFDISTYPRGAALGIKSKKHYDAVGAETASSQPVGTGPWELVEDKEDVLRRTKAVRNHWRKTPEWDEMVWWQINEESTRLANFLVGQLDSALLTAASIQAVKNENDPNIKFFVLDGGGTHYAYIHGQQYYTDHPLHVSGSVPLGDNAYDCSLAWVSCDRDVNSAEWANTRKVREAMAIAIDREALVNNLAFGAGSPIYLNLAVGYEERMQQLGLDQLRFEYNPDRARQLLAEAGFAGGFEINMYEVPTCSSAAVVTSEAISGMLREIGLTVNELKSPDSTVRPLRVDRTMKGIQVIGGCGPTPREPLTSLGLYWTVDSAFNYGFEHPTYQDLVNAALDEQDLEERWAIQGEIIKFLYDEVMTIPLYQETLLFPLGPELDTWTRAGSAVPQAYLSNWEYAPHRQ